MRVVREPHRRLVQAARTLDPDVGGPVDHDLGHGLVREQAFERPMAEDVVGQLVDESLPVLPRDPGLLG